MCHKASLYAANAIGCFCIYSPILACFFGSPVYYWPFSSSLASLVGDLRPLPNLPHDTGAIKTSDFSLLRTIYIPPPPHLGSKNSWRLKAGTETALSKYLWNARMNGYMKTLHDRISAVMGDGREGCL